MKRNTNLLIIASLLAISAGGLMPASFTKGPVNWTEKLAKGYADLSLGNIDQGIKFFSEKVKKNPDSAACHTGLGIALKKKGKIDDARREFQKATEVEPTFADAYYELGSVLESDQNWAGAAAAFEKFVANSSDERRKMVVSERIRACKDHLN